jgi:ABC-type nitrate/sulfonate/bicarbonate transport system substrate-binding protein
MVIDRRKMIATLGVAAFGGMATGMTSVFAQQKRLSLVEIMIARPVTVLAQGIAVDAALKMGAFQQEGLSAKIINFRAWSDVVNAIPSRPGIFGYGASSLIRGVMGQNAPLRQICMTSDSFPFQFWVRGDSGIKSVADLKGKRIQTVRPGETLDYVWAEILADAGLSMSDVVRVEGFDGFGALISNTVDAANMNDTLFTKARSANLVPILDYNGWRKKHSLPIAGNNLGYGTSLETLQKHPDTTRAFLRALIRATVKLRSDRAFAIEVLSAPPYSQTAAGAAELYERHKDHWIIRMDPARGDMQIDIDRAAKALNLNPVGMNPHRFMAIEPAADALRELKVTF